MVVKYISRVVQPSPYLVVGHVYPPQKLACLPKSGFGPSQVLSFITSTVEMLGLRNQSVEIYIN